MLQRFSLYDTSYAGTSDFTGAPNIFFFCKITVRRSKYFLEISKPREKRKLSGYTFQLRPSWSRSFSTNLHTIFGVVFFAFCQATAIID